MALMIGMFCASPAMALRVNFSSGGDADKLIFSFDSGELPSLSVRRTGTRTMTVSLPSGVWDNERKPGSKDFPGKLVESIRAGENSVTLAMRTNAFGFIKVPVPGKPQFVLQLFRDPIGARWKPKTAPQAAQADPAPVTPAPAQEPDKPQPQPAQAEPEPAPKPTPAPEEAAPKPEQPTALPQGEADLPPETAEGDRKPFFSVPYSQRQGVAPPPDAEPVEPVSPGVEDGDYPASSELRFKAVNKTAEEVKFAELAGSPEGAAPVAEPRPESGQSTVAGTIGGSVKPPESQGQGQAGGAVSPSPEAQPVQQVEKQPVRQPVRQPGQAEPVRQVDDGVSGSVSPPEETAPSAAVSQVVETSGAGQAGGSVAPPPSVVEGAPPPEPTEEEAATVAETVAPPSEPATQLSEAEQIAAAEGGGETPAADVAEDVELASADADNATSEEEANEQAIRDKLYEAQNMMFSGALEGALPIFEEILREPKVPDDVREETLFAVADIKKELYSDSIDEHFDEVAQAYIEAMNANVDSNRVPRALVSLGLINLKVGNFPEAKAYFKILQEKYPDDENIPSISYYWGEYYYRKGEYKKAADQFQYLIQTYPEHELVKQAAFYLADALNRTGFVEQAYQIVDYIDKRWPDYYMENHDYLILAGGVEMQLGKWLLAKNHFFTHYNLNPESDRADVVLARLGDIYIRQDQEDAAKQMYEKAIADYPDSEGGLIAKMRLAEEGIYDDPRMTDMVTVFDRPYNKRPENVYKEIVEKHPDNPLALIAQLKLAMWYAFHEKYPEALAAAQDFIDKYPDSKQVDKARALGDSVFALAVPGMVEEGRYGRIVRYWETYDFIDQKDTRVDDRTRLNVATSYWKVGQPEKALEIIKPFLQERQIPEISNEALGLAVNIYLDELAWKEIDDLVSMAKKNWTLDEAQARQLDYARAMSLQNLGEDNQALAMWAELAKDMSVDPAFRAYAMYYMAKGAMERQDLRKVFVYAQEALTLLLKTNGDPEKIKDTVLMSIYATERSGRYDEALKWARQYDEYIDVDNPEWASTRFKLARIYRKAGAIDEWKQLLGDIIEKKPETLQAQLAKSALETYELEQQVQQYAPSPQ